jgi:hypothetical protein
MTTYAVRTQDQRDALVEEMERLQAQAIPRAKIADMLGLTKNQVHGMLWKARQKRLKETTHKVIDEPILEEVAQPVVEMPLPIATDISFDPPPGKFNIWNIKALQCRWPNEDGYFCGEPTGSHQKSYCSHHHKLSWVKPSRKKTWRNSRPKALPNYA